MGQINKAKTWSQKGKRYVTGVKLDTGLWMNMGIAHKRHQNLNRTSSVAIWGLKATQVVISNLRFVVWDQDKNSLK